MEFNATFFKSAIATAESLDHHALYISFHLGLKGDDLYAWVLIKSKENDATLKYVTCPAQHLIPIIMSMNIVIKSLYSDDISPMENARTIIDTLYQGTIY